MAYQLNTTLNKEKVISLKSWRSSLHFTSLHTHIHNSALRLNSPLKSRRLRRQLRQWQRRWCCSQMSITFLIRFNPKLSHSTGAKACQHKKWHEAVQKKATATEQNKKWQNILWSSVGVFGFLRCSLSPLHTHPHIVLLSLSEQRTPDRSGSWCIPNCQCHAEALNDNCTYKYFQLRNFVCCVSK